MLSLSAVALLEKNRLSTDGAWLVLLEITLGATTLYLVRNTEDITWNGQLWTAFPFELDDLTEDGKELPQLTIRIGNVSRVVQGYVEAADGGSGASVILRVVNSKNLAGATAEIEGTFQVVKTSCDALWARFTLGAPSPMQIRILTRTPRRPTRPRRPGTGRCCRT